MTKIDFNQMGPLLEGQRWIFAKTMRDNPHEYTLRKNWVSDADFARVVNFIRSHGYKKVYRGKEYICLNVNEHYYWTMGAPINETTLINRKRITRQGVYDSIAPVYDSLFCDKSSLRENADIKTMLGDLRTKNVLDIGCGTGLFLSFGPTASYLGIDPSPLMVGEFKKKHPDMQHRVICTTLQDFSSGCQYDLIVALFGAASYLNTTELKKIRTLLAPRGKAFLMFYRDGYTPVTYVKTGIYLNPISSANLYFTGKTPWGNFDIVKFTKTEVSGP